MCSTTSMPGTDGEVILLYWGELWQNH